MKISYSSKFVREYKHLSLSHKKKAEKQEELFLKNPYDPKLDTHPLKGRLKGLWSFSIDTQYRIIFEFVEKDDVWFHSVGTHDIYKR